MKLAFSIAIATLFVLAPAASANLVDVAITAPAAPGAYIVGFHEMPDLTVGDSYNGAEITSTTPDLRFITVNVENFATFQAASLLDENVRYIETDVSDHKLHFVPNDYYWSHSSNWAFNKIGAPTAWDKTLGTTAVKNGHVDSGLNKGHEEYAGQSRVLGGWDFYSGDNNPDDGRGCSWHGTHTTGSAAATINNGKGFPGMAQMQILPVKIFGGGGCLAASVTNLANALKYVGDQGAHVSSNSWGGGSYSTAINDAIIYSFNKGVIFVAAAGNSDCTNCIGNPWKPVADKVIIVTATDVNDNGASFNSEGPEVDISAPGVDIGQSTSGTNGYHIMSGTSMATPHVTGLVGLIKTLNPSYGYSQIDNRIKSTAVDLGPAGHDSTFGYGRINAAAAVY
ncbi:MAG TPA: S8 family serine peptidase [Candidatus Thermoplasmatota archaeon]|nr:S8 family serine peptidase [Candidatus Thermoplasmatota archaeon]